MITPKQMTSSTPSETPQSHLNTLSFVFLVNTSISAALSVDTSSLRELLGAMELLFEYRLGVDLLELGLEVLQAGSVAAAVGSATSIGHVEAFILDFFSIDTPRQS